MRSARCRTALSFHAILAVVGALIGTGTPARAEVTGDLDVLPLVAKTHKANRDALRTWRGRALVRFEWFAPGHEDHERVITHDLGFVLDRPAKARRWVIRAEGGGSVNLNDGVKRRRPPREHRGLVAGDTFTEVLGFPPGGRPSRVALRTRDEGADQGVAEPARFDPTTWSATMDVAATATAYHERPRAFDNPWVVRRERDLVTIELRLPERGDLLNRYVIDLSKGAALVSFTASGARTGETRRDYDYERVAGVWVPKRSSFRLSEWEGGRLVVKRVNVCELRDSRVNDDIAPGEFTIDALGLPDGCQVVDERPGPDKGKATRYKAPVRVSRVDED